VCVSRYVLFYACFPKEDKSHMMKWLKDSGLKINENKTEICIFHKNDTRVDKIPLNGTEILIKNEL